MDREVAPQLITSGEIDMVAEAESDLARSGDDVSKTALFTEALSIQ
jgi:hypothetical protein